MSAAAGSARLWCRARASGAIAAPASGLIERCQIRLTALGDEDLSALDLTRARVIRTGWRILHELTACVASTRPSPEPIHLRLAAAWRLDETGSELVRRCLV